MWLAPLKAAAQSGNGPAGSELDRSAEVREALIRHVEFLASSELAGRLTGTPEASRAVDYLAEALESMGARPLPGTDGFRLPFEFTAGVDDAGSSVRVAAGDGETIPMSFDTAIAGSGIVAASISAEVAGAILEPTGRSLGELQAELDTANPHVTGFSVQAVEVDLSIAVERERRTGYNVVGYLPGGAADERAEPWVVLGAHYDHLGLGRHGNSLAKKEEVGLPHPGADDNASGVAAVLVAAEALASAELDRHVVVAFWTGEELGLLGSSHFVDDGPLPLERIAAYLNFDMVGRSRENKLTLQAVGSSEAWPRFIERSNVPVGFDLVLQEDPYLPTDSLPFNRAGVPTLNFFTGSHADYHRPTDRPDAINYDDLARVARLATLITTRLANAADAPGFVEVERKRQEGGDRRRVAIVSRARN